MKKTLSILIMILFGFFVQNSLGQEKFNSDYIVKKEGDTIYGAIEYENKQPNLVKFKNLQNEMVRSSRLKT
ncbi:hypothetical protein ACFQ0I_17055 [Mariniflexile aquimaris]|uniref:GLPGLI family protein n=1 Tax=Mariniflexile aquimaris TaxID=881009 RepID=A0ABW3BYG6_9FLAO